MSVCTNFFLSYTDRTCRANAKNNLDLLLTILNKAFSDTNEILDDVALPTGTRIYLPDCGGAGSSSNDYRDSTAADVWYNLEFEIGDIQAANAEIAYQHLLPGGASKTKLEAVAANISAQLTAALSSQGVVDNITKVDVLETPAATKTKLNNALTNISSELFYEAFGGVISAFHTKLFNDVNSLIFPSGYIFVNAVKDFVCEASSSGGDVIKSTQMRYLAAEYNNLILKNQFLSSIATERYSGLSATDVQRNQNSVKSICGSAQFGTNQFPFLFETAECQALLLKLGMDNEITATTASTYCFNVKDVDISGGLISSHIGLTLSMRNYPIFYSTPCKNMIRDVIFLGSPEISRIVHDDMKLFCGKYANNISSEGTNLSTPYAPLLTPDTIESIDHISAAAESLSNVANEQADEGLSILLRGGAFKIWGSISHTASLSDTSQSVDPLKVLRAKGKVNSDQYKNVAILHVCVGGSQRGSDMSGCTIAADQIPGYDPTAPYDVENLKTRPVPTTTKTVRTIVFNAAQEQVSADVTVREPYSPSGVMWVREDCALYSRSGVRYVDIFKNLPTDSSIEKETPSNVISLRVEPYGKMKLTPSSTSEKQKLFFSASELVAQISQVTIVEGNESFYGYYAISLTNIRVNSPQIFMTQNFNNNEYTGVVVGGGGVLTRITDPTENNEDSVNRVAWNEIPNPIEGNVSDTVSTNVLGDWSLNIYWNVQEQSSFRSPTVFLGQELVDWKKSPGKKVNILETLATPDKDVITGAIQIDGDSSSIFLKSLCACHMDVANNAKFYDNRFTIMMKYFKGLDSFANNTKCLFSGCAASDFPAENMVDSQASAINVQVASTTRPTTKLDDLQRAGYTKRCKLPECLQILRIVANKISILDGASLNISQNCQKQINGVTDESGTIDGKVVGIKELDAYGNVKDTGAVKKTGTDEAGISRAKSLFFGVLVSLSIIALIAILIFIGGVIFLVVKKF